MDTTLKLLTGTEQFKADTIAGLKAKPKFMHSKYFYDQRGDVIFQQIMNLSEYYLTSAEMDVISNQSPEIAGMLLHENSPFDLIELGAGDASKSIHLLTELVSRKAKFSYLPIDISVNVIRNLENELPVRLPQLEIAGFNGDYLDMLDKAVRYSNHRKVILFMGANIGNMRPDEALSFCRSIRKMLSKGDMLIIGFDLKKNPGKILAAYNDPSGVTRSFNLNLLARINRELGADFDQANFEHYATYDPESGACKSFLISQKDHFVKIDETTEIHFSENEHVFMEISQKYSVEEIELMALRAGFGCNRHFFDKNHYLADSVWVPG